MGALEENHTIMCSISLYVEEGGAIVPSFYDLDVLEGFFRVVKENGNYYDYGHMGYLLSCAIICNFHDIFSVVIYSGCTDVLKVLCKMVI